MDESAAKRGYLHEEYRLFHNRDDYGTSMETHYHDFYKLVIMMEGSGCYTIEGRKYRLQPGDIILVGSGLVHKPEIEAGIMYERIIFFISSAFLALNSTTDCDLTDVFAGKYGHVLRTEEKRRQHILDLALKAEELLKDERFGSSVLARTLLMQILVEIGREQQGGSHAFAMPLENSSGKTPEIIRYLDQHLTEDISIDSLAEHFFISKYHMMRCFRQEVGTSIHNYLSGKRLLAARDMLRDGRSATDTCYACGFKTYSAFARAYTKFFGCSPSDKEQSSTPKGWRFTSE